MDRLLHSGAGAHAWARAAWSALALIITAILTALTVPARAQPVDLALVLAVDASGSVDRGRFELQKQGYAAAFRSPRVIKAIRSGAAQAIAVTMVQWTGPLLHGQVIGWTVIRDSASAEAFAAAIERTPRQLFGGGTSISGAIDYSRLLLLKSPFAAARRLIDVSGDGANNRGRDVTLARDEAVRDGIAINGLPILALEPHLDRYYYDAVIGGPGAFMIPAASYEAFADAVLKKLVMEIAAGDWRLARVGCPSPAQNGRIARHEYAHRNTGEWICRHP